MLLHFRILSSDLHHINYQCNQVSIRNCIFKNEQLHSLVDWIFISWAIWWYYLNTDNSMSLKHCGNININIRATKTYFDFIVYSTLLNVKYLYINRYKNISLLFHHLFYNIKDVKYEYIELYGNISFDFIIFCTVLKYAKQTHKRYKHISF